MVSPLYLLTIDHLQAGANNVIGSAFADLGAIIRQVDDKSRVGVCLDTCLLRPFFLLLHMSNRFRHVRSCVCCGTDIFPSYSKTHKLSPNNRDTTSEQKMVGSKRILFDMLALSRHNYSSYSATRTTYRWLP